MKSVSFSIRRVNRLRQAAERARTDLPPVPDGWSASACRANELLRAFDALWLKPGFALHAYEYRVGDNGNGVIWAVPTNAPLLAPDDCPGNDDGLLRTPQPPGAVPLMQALEGDGSPWSYLSASILCREAAEFGALWHGCVWSDQTILSKAPQQIDDQEREDRTRNVTGDAHVSNWTWCGAVPPLWKPTYADNGTTREVVLHIHNPVGREEIYRATDMYPAGSYDGETETTVLCRGQGGFVY